MLHVFALKHSAKLLDNKQSNKYYFTRNAYFAFCQKYIIVLQYARFFRIMIGKLKCSNAFNFGNNFKKWVIETVEFEGKFHFIMVQETIL